MTPPPGLSKIDTASGTRRRVSTAPGYWEAADGKIAWGTDGWATVRILDPSTGVSREIYKSSHKIVNVAGVTGAGALVFESDASGPFTTSVVTADGSVQGVDVPAALQGKYFNGYFQDGSTILISGHGFGLAAYDPEHGLKVLTISPDNFEILGRCVAA